MTSAPLYSDFKLNANRVWLKSKICPDPRRKSLDPDPRKNVFRSGSFSSLVFYLLESHMKAYSDEFYYYEVAESDEDFEFRSNYGIHRMVFVL